MDDFDGGYLRHFAVAARLIMERDDVLSVTVPKRIGQVSRRSWDVLISEDVPPELEETAKLHQQTLKRFYSRLKVRSAVEPDQTGGVRMLVNKMMEARFLRYTSFEIQWAPDAEGMTATLHHVPVEYLETTRGVVRFAGVDYATPGLEMQRPNWLIVAADGCIMKAAAVAWMFKRLSLQDWLNLSGKFGIPGIHMETTAAPGSREWDQASAALEAFANDWILLTSQGSKINILSAATASGEGPFAPLVDRMDRALARICMGSDLSTISRQEGAGASLQGSDTDEMICDDCDWISETIQEQLDRRVIAWAFGEGVQPLAYFALTGPQKEDVKLEMEVDKHVKEFGVSLSIEDVAERYNRTHTEPPAPVTPPPAAAAPVDPAPSQAPAAAPPVPAANDNAAAAREAGRKALLKTLQGAVKSDLKPLADALMTLEQAATPDAARNAVLSLDLAALETRVMDREAGDLALETIMAANLLAGLARTPEEAQEAAAITEIVTETDAANDGLGAAFEVLEQGRLFVPYGEYPHSAGMQVVDRAAGEAMRAQMHSILGWARKMFVGYPVFLGHPDHPNAERRKEFPDKRAYGWVKDIEVANDGIVFVVKYNGLGAALVQDGQVGYHSPYWRMQPLGKNTAGKSWARPVSLISIGLTNSPNIPVPAIIAANSQTENAS